MRSVVFFIVFAFVLFLLIGCSQNTTVSNTANSTAITGAVSGEITWSGYTWETKSYSYKVGPGPNYFSDSIDNLWVDSDGKLHLKITKVGDDWYCPELGTKDSFGYGTYRFYASTRFDNLNENIVVGIFTWDDTSSDYYNREIDIEFARWGNMAWPNLNFTVQPYGTVGNVKSTDVAMTGDLSTHWFKWQSDRVDFQSIHGHYSTSPSSDYLMDEWSYTGANVPLKGNEKVRLNLWLRDGVVPSDSKEVEFIIDSFEFVP